MLTLLCSDLLAIRNLSQSSKQLLSRRISAALHPNMSSRSSESPNESCMGDSPGNATQSHASATNNNGTQRDGDAVNKPKRIACVLCRRRKLRCDGARPTCGTCKRLAHDCAYDEVRKKSGPKRGYVKLLEARLRMCPDLHSNLDNY